MQCILTKYLIYSIMSKAQLKKFLKDLDRDQLEEFILDLYSDSKPAREYIDFFLNPNVEKLVETTQKSLYKKFYRPNGDPVSNVKFTKVNDIMKDFTDKVHDPRIVADMMVFLLNLICDYGSRYCYTESYVRSVISNFRRFSNWLVSNSLEKEYHEKMETLITKTQSIGWLCTDGVYSAIDDAFIEDD